MSLHGWLNPPNETDPWGTAPQRQKLEEEASKATEKKGSEVGQQSGKYSVRQAKTKKERNHFKKERWSVVSNDAEKSRRIEVLKNTRLVKIIVHLAETTL